MAARPLEVSEAQGIAVSAPRVLIVRFSAIGDCVMAAYAVSALRRAQPDAHLVWAADPRCSVVIDREHCVSEVFDIPRDQWKRDRTSWFQQLRYYARLRKHEFDFGFDLQGHSKTAVCLRVAGPKRRLAVESLDPISSLLTPKARTTAVHLVERMALTIAELLPVSTIERPFMPGLAAERSSVAKHLQLGRSLVTIHIGAGAEWKRWPIERWEAVARAIGSEGFKVAFLGAKGDAERPLENGLDLVGKLTLAESMAAVAQSALHLAADTGSGHMAAAQGVPVVSVFGRTNPSRYRPYVVDSPGVVLQNGASTELVSVEDVLKAVASIRDTLEPDE